MKPKPIDREKLSPSEKKVYDILKKELIEAREKMLALERLFKRGTGTISFKK